MRRAHACHSQSMRVTHGRTCYDASMTITDATRTLALELPETEWQALRALEPDAVAWLRTLIHTRVTAGEQRTEVEEFDDY